MDLWKRFNVPFDMPDGFVARPLGRFVHEQGFDDDDLTGLRGDFLLRKLGLHVGSLEGVSMGRLFGNFMGMAGALGVMAHTARLNDEGYVIRNDSENIFRFISLIQQHIPVFGRGLSSEMHHTVSAAAQYYLGAAQELGDVLFTMHNRVFKTVSGQTVTPGKIGTKNIEKWFRASTSASEQLRQLLKGGQLFLTRLGLNELSGWVDKYTRPLRFLDSDIARHAAMDRFGTIDALPTVHPAYAASVGRILTDAMMAAEQQEMELRFRWDGGRQAIITDVPTLQARAFEELLERGGTAISPSDERDQHWVERLGDKHRLVIPTQGYFMMQQFGDVAVSTVGEVAGIVSHLRSVNPQGKFDPDLPDSRGRSLRDKLICLNAVINPKDGVLKRMADSLGGKRAQEARVVTEWSRRLMHLSKTFVDLHHGLGDSGAFAAQRELCLREGMFNILNHIPPTRMRWSIEGFNLDVISPTPYVKPADWLDNYKRLLKFYMQSALIAGAPAEDSTVSRNVTAIVGWNSDDTQLTVTNTEDRRLVEFWGGAISSYLAGDTRAVPRLACEVIELSQRLDPAGGGLSVDRGAGIISMPMQLQQSASPIEARYTALRRTTGLAGMPRLPR
jgi:hypothetical protein